MNQETENLLNAIITALVMEARFALSQAAAAEGDDGFPLEIVSASLFGVAAAIARVKEAAQANDAAKGEA